MMASRCMFLPCPSACGIRWKTCCDNALSAGLQLLYYVQACLLLNFPVFNLSANSDLCDSCCCQWTADEQRARFVARFSSVTPVSLEAIYREECEGNGIQHNLETVPGKAEQAEEEEHLGEKIKKQDQNLGSSRLRLSSIIFNQ